jgi:NTE family protein
MNDAGIASINIMQVQIARSRKAGQPPDVTVGPRLAHLRLLAFHRAKEAIEGTVAPQWSESRTPLLC